MASDIPGLCPDLPRCPIGSTGASHTLSHGHSAAKNVLAYVHIGRERVRMEHPLLAARLVLYVVTLACAYLARWMSLDPWQKRHA